MTGKVLIIDSVAINRIVLKARLREAFYLPVVAADVVAGFRLAVAERPDAILLDLDLPDEVGLGLLNDLRADPRTNRIPILMMSAQTDAAQRFKALSSGADDVLTRPINEEALLARLRHLARLRDEAAEFESPTGQPVLAGLAENAPEFIVPGCLALITDRPDAAARMRRELAGTLPDHVALMTRAEALADPASEDCADVYVIDEDLGGPGGGLRLMSDLRSRAGSRHSAVCILRRPENNGSTAVAFDLGADDVTETTRAVPELALRLRRLMGRKQTADRRRAAVQDNVRLSSIDELTGLFNRRHALPRLATIAAEAAAQAQSYCVMVVDLDRFKAVNDRFGHAAGDLVLEDVARRLSDNVRDCDLLARIGGEEFLIGLPDTSLSEAQDIADRLRNAVHQQKFELPNGIALSVTVSIGLAISESRSGEAAADVIERADRALMQAKSAGRNTVTISRVAA